MRGSTFDLAGTGLHESLGRGASAKAAIDLGDIRGRFLIESDVYLMDTWDKKKDSFEIKLGGETIFKEKIDSNNQGSHLNASGTWEGLSWSLTFVGSAERDVEKTFSGQGREDFKYEFKLWGDPSRGKQERFDLEFVANTDEGTDNESAVVRNLQLTAAGYSGKTTPTTTDLPEIIIDIFPPHVPPGETVGLPGTGLNKALGQGAKASTSIDLDDITGRFLISSDVYLSGDWDKNKDSFAITLGGETIFEANIDSTDPRSHVSATGNWEGLIWTLIYYGTSGKSDKPVVSNTEGEDHKYVFTLSGDPRNGKQKAFDIDFIAKTDESLVNESAVVRNLQLTAEDYSGKTTQIIVDPPDVPPGETTDLLGTGLDQALGQGAKAATWIDLGGISGDFLVSSDVYLFDTWDQKNDTFAITLGKNTIFKEKIASTNQGSHLDRSGTWEGLNWSLTYAGVAEKSVKDVFSRKGREDHKYEFKLWGNLKDSKQKEFELNFIAHTDEGTDNESAVVRNLQFTAAAYTVPTEEPDPVVPTEEPDPVAPTDGGNDPVAPGETVDLSGTGLNTALGRGAKASTSIDLDDIKGDFLISSDVYLFDTWDKKKDKFAITLGGETIFEEKIDSNNQGSHLDQSGTWEGLNWSLTYAGVAEKSVKNDFSKAGREDHKYAFKLWGDAKDGKQQTFDLDFIAKTDEGTDNESAVVRNLQLTAAEYQGPTGGGGGDDRIAPTGGGVIPTTTITPTTGYIHDCTAFGRGVGCVILLVKT